MTITFDHTVESCFSAATHKEYKEKINGLETLGGTDFVPVMQHVKQLISTQTNVNEFFIMFVTDG